MSEVVPVTGDGSPEWFEAHFDQAADQTLAFLSDAGRSIEGRTVADIGCGDGIIDLGLAIKGKPEKLIGFDVRPPNVDGVARAAQAAGVGDQLPGCLSFQTSSPREIPAEDDTFDVVVTWSVFEHVTYPVAMLSEVARILKPDGVLFLQLWPFYYSEHGGHLWPHYTESFPHLRHTDAEIREHLSGRRGTDPTRDAVDEYESLNHVSVDQLQRGLLAAGLVVTKLELLTSAFHIPRELAHLPLSLLGIGGVKLLAVLP